MATGEEVALEPALAEVLAQYLHHAALGGEVVIPRHRLRDPLPVGYLEHRIEAVRVGLVRPEEAEIARPLIEPDDVAQEIP